MSKSYQWIKRRKSHKNLSSKCHTPFQLLLHINIWNFPIALRRRTFENFRCLCVLFFINLKKMNMKDNWMYLVKEALWKAIKLSRYPEDTPLRVGLKPHQIWKLKVKSLLDDFEQILLRKRINKSNKFIIIEFFLLTKSIKFHTINNETEHFRLIKRHHFENWLSKIEMVLLKNYCSKSLSYRNLEVLHHWCICFEFAKLFDWIVDYSIIFNSSTELNVGQLNMAWTIWKCKMWSWNNK